MRFPRSVFAVLAVLLVAAAARPVSAQQSGQHVSCVKCHALSMQQAMADFRGAGLTQGHGYAFSPPLEMVCQNCHDTYAHEQNPETPPSTPFFLWRTGGYGSPMARACLSCHASQPPVFDPLTSHPHDIIPYSGGTAPMAEPPTSVLPLFDQFGHPDQNPYGGGLVCTTCHDPHNPSYPVLGRSKFLRIGAYENTAPLCGYCHTAEATPPTTGYDLVIPSRTDSVRFETLPYGDQRIEVTVRNRGNAYSNNEYADVFWVNEAGYYQYVGQLSIPPLAPESETIAPFFWMPPAEWSPGAGSYHFAFHQPSPLLPDSMPPVEFVRAMYVLPSPTNVRVGGVGPAFVTLAWDAPVNPPMDLAWDVYRDGVKVTPMPVPFSYSPEFIDGDLAPETPHVYTVVAVRMTSGVSSLPSNPVGATTAVGAIIRVPQDVATIGEAINAAYSGTSIHVAPGTYAEPIMLGAKSGITIKGQDANGCVLDYTSGPMPIDLGYGVGNTLAGFTIRNNTVNMDAGDVVTECVIVNDGARYSGPAVGGGGLVAQCVIDTQDRLSAVVPPDRALTSVNSIYLGPQPFNASDLDNATFLLLNNDFPSWLGYWDVPGSGNFPDPPIFDNPGAPLTYRPAYSSPTNYRGFPLEDPYYIPDVGAFQAGMPYTPQPPANLTGGLAPVFPPYVHIEWEPSIDDPGRMMDYYIYRSTAPDFEAVPASQPYAMVPSGMYAFDDGGLLPGETYYYQVRAYGGNAVEYPHAQLISAATGTVSVTWANSPPVALDDAAFTPEDMPVTVPVLANDSDPDPGDLLTVTAVGMALNGGAYLNPDDTVTYFPEPGFSGTDSFTYTVTDMFGGTATATVTVTVTNQNQPPVAVNDVFTIPEDMMLSFAPGGGVLVNDTDADGDPLQAILEGGPALGSLTLRPDGSFTYYPPPNFNGTVSFSYRAGDGQSVSAVATVTITVTPVNDPPRGVNDACATAEDTMLTIAAPGVLANDSDVDGDFFQPVLVSPPQHGTLHYLFSVGAFSYTPAADFNGTDSFTYRLFDGTSYSVPPTTVTITVTSVNDAPTAAADSYTTPEDNALVVAAPGLLANDSDPDGDPLGAVLAAGPQHGTLALSLNGSFTYTPAPGFNGTDTFTYTAGDLWATAPDATVTITVTPVNDPPVAVDDTAATAACVPAVIAVLGNDSDEDGGALSLSSTTQGANGTTAIQGGGSVLYTPNAGFTGTDSFSYTVADGNGGTDTATVVVTVRPQKLRIADVTMATVTAGRYTNATATLLVVDEAGAPLAGVSIAGAWSGLTSDADSGLTGGDGKLTVSSNQVRNPRGIFTFTIESAAKAGYELDGPASVLTNAIEYPPPPPPPPAGGEMHVASIEMGLKTGKVTSANATVTVVDASGAPVASAAVSGAWSGAAEGTATGTTGADGRVALSSPGVKSAAGKTFTFTVTGMTLSGWTYDSAADVETSESITAP